MSFLFSAAGDEISLAAPIATPPQFTVVVWLKVASAQGGLLSLNELFANYPDNPFISLNGSGNLRLLSVFSTSGGDFNAPIGYAPDTWIAVAVTYDGSNVANVPAIYSRLESDGSLISRTVATASTPVGTFVTTPDTWYAGGIFTSYHFPGRLAYLQFFNRILNSTELNAAVNNPGSILSGLIVSWKQLDDPSSDHTADDSSGNNYHGAVSGGTALSGDNPTLPAAGYSRIGSVSASYTTADSGAMTPNLDTRNAKLLVAVVSDLGNASVFVDPLGNTFLRPDSGHQPGVYYCINPPFTSATHNWSVSGTGQFGSVAVTAYSYSGTPAFDQQSQHGTSGPTASVSTGLVTPLFVNELLVAGFLHFGAYSSIDSGFSAFEHIDHTSGTAIGLVMADLVETAIAAKNPTVTMAASTGFNTTGVVLTFTQAVGGGLAAAIIRRRR